MKVKSLRYLQVVVSIAEIMLPLNFYINEIISPLDYTFPQEKIGDANISLMDSLRI